MIKLSSHFFRTYKYHWTCNLAIYPFFQICIFFLNGDLQEFFFFFSKRFLSIEDKYRRASFYLYKYVVGPLDKK